MQCSRAAAITILVVALAIGLLSTWMPSSPHDWTLVGLHTAIPAVALYLFFVLLPGRMKLPGRIFVAMVLGSITGWALAQTGDEPFVADWLGLFGSVFILLLKLVVIPLIFTSIVCGVAGLGDIRRLGSLGAKAISYYLLTTLLAVTVGLAMVNLIQPGVGLALSDVQPTAATTGDALPLGQQLQKHALPMVIRDPLMGGENPLAVIFFALLLGTALATLGDKGKPALEVFRALDTAFITIIMWIMAIAPIGVFALMAGVIADLGLIYIVTLAKYCATVWLALGTHFCLLVFLVCPLLGRVSPWRFLRGMAPMFEVSFSTSSSSATLPVTIECVTRRVGADKNISGFMLPIGATINMDGTALFVTVASIFIAQVYNIPLTLWDQVMIYLTAVSVSVGTAGIPGASLGLISLILNSAGIPVEGVGMIAGVDRPLDMSRTVVNVTGDAVGAVVISRMEGAMRDGPMPIEVSDT